jgi:hypothetical protein
MDYGTATDALLYQRHHATRVQPPTDVSAETGALTSIGVASETRAPTSIGASAENVHTHKHQRFR